MAIPLQNIKLELFPIVNELKPKEFYRNHLPHLQPLGGTFFVTYNLADAVPYKLWKKWKEEIQALLAELESNSSLFSSQKHLLDQKDAYLKKAFAKYDKYLDSNNGPLHLKNPQVANVVADSLHFWDNKKLELIGYSIMPNHVHTTFRLFSPEELDGSKVYLEKIMQSIKLYSARNCNKILGKTGTFWQRESYDRLVRDRNELHRILTYTVCNPVKAGLCSSPKEWPWTYVKEKYNDVM